MSGALSSVAALLTQAGQTSGAQMAQGAEKFTASAETTAAACRRPLMAFTLAVNRLTTRLDHTEATLDAQNLTLSQPARSSPAHQTRSRTLLAAWKRRLAA